LHSFQINKNKSIFNSFYLCTPTTGKIFDQLRYLATLET